MVKSGEDWGVIEYSMGKIQTYFIELENLSSEKSQSNNLR